MFWHRERALGWPSIAFYHSLSLFGRIRSVFFSFYQFILTNQHAVTLRPMHPQSWWIIEGCIRDNMASWSWWWDAHRIWQQTMWFVLHCFHHQFLMTCTARVRHSRNVDQMAEIINAEQDSDDQDNPKPSQKHKRKPKQKADESDKDDADFVGSASKSDSGSEDDDVEITNIEVCSYLTLWYILFSELFSKLADSLPSKTIPSGRSRKSKGKKPAWKRKHVVDTLESSYVQSVSQSTSQSKSGKHITRKTVRFTLQTYLSLI